MKLLIAILCVSILSVGLLVSGQVRAATLHEKQLNYESCRNTVDNLYRENNKLRRQVKNLKHKLLE